MQQSKRKQNYWFKRRRYGYGWIPVTWQGWTPLVILLLIILGGTFLLKDTPRNTFKAEVGVYMIVVFIAVSALVVLSYFKGPKPKWRWGKKAGDNPDEDF